MKNEFYMKKIILKSLDLDWISLLDSLSLSLTLKDLSESLFGYIFLLLLYTVDITYPMRIQRDLLLGLIHDQIYRACFRHAYFSNLP